MRHGVKPDPELPIILDGNELPDDYGVSFEQEEQEEVIDLLGGFSFIKSSPLLRCWITRRNFKGEYEKLIDVTGKTVLLWDDQGRAWEYENYTIKVTEDIEPDGEINYDEEEDESE